MAVNQGDPVTLSFSTVIEGKTYRTDVTVRTAPAAQEAPAEPPAPAPAPAPAPGTLSAVITLGRKSYTAAESAAKDLGDFSSPIGGIVQRCLRADIPELNMTVFFRPDRDGRRDEVVFELGRLFVDQAAVPAALGAYTAQVYRGSQLLARVDVPAHYWHSRWRWQSAPRPVVGDARALISSGLLPPLSQAAPAVPYAASYKAVPYEVMGLAGVTPYMPQTGERPDIGLVTAYQADYICTGSGQALAVTLAQGEASGTVPWHQRDEVTGAPIDFAVHTKASWYSDSRAGAPWIKGSPGASATPDNAHTPALAYVPYVLTGDPYMLEELQFMANNTWGSEPMGYRPNVGQSRAFAWSMRTIGQAARVTPASVPSWLLPQAYWKGMLDRHRAHVEANYVGGAGPLLSVFRSTCPIDNSRGGGRRPRRDVDRRLAGGVHRGRGRVARQDGARRVAQGLRLEGRVDDRPLQRDRRLAEGRPRGVPDHPAPRPHRPDGGELGRGVGGHPEDHPGLRRGRPLRPEVLRHRHDLPRLLARGPGHGRGPGHAGRGRGPLVGHQGAGGQGLEDGPQVAPGGRDLRKTEGALL